MVWYNRGQLCFEAEFCCLFVLFIFFTRGTTSDVKHRAIVTQIHSQRYRQYHVCLFFLFFLQYTYAVVKQTPVLSFHTTQRTCFLLPRPTFEDTGSTMSACFFLLFFRYIYTVVKQTPVLSFHTTQRTC